MELDNIILDYFLNGTISLEEFSKTINRSPGAIYKRAAIIGAKNNKTKEIWTLKEDEFLINNIGFAPLYSISPYSYIVLEPKAGIP